MITTVCKISYGSQTVPPIVPAVQGDTGRAISFEIADFTPPAGATATYFILKPSGEAIYNSATITDNSILCELTAQSLAEAGENRMQVRVLQGENIVTSFEVILMVRTFLGDDAMESGTEMNIFDQAVAQATEQFQENAEQIVAEVIESIPEDYTELTEEVGQLNERFDSEITFADEAFENGSVDYALVYTNNTINSNTGEIGVESPKRAVTPAMYFLPVNCNIYVKTLNSTVYTYNVYCYSESKDFIGKLASRDILALSNIPVVSGTKYVRFFVIRKDDGNLTPQDAASAITVECVYNGRVSVLDNEITVLQAKTDKIAVNNNLLYGFNLNDGYYDGAHHSSNDYKYFAKVPVKNGKTYIAYPRARMIYIYTADGTLINYLNQQNITQITAEGDGFAYVTYYAADNLDSALFYEEGANNVYPRNSLALSDDIIQTGTLTGKKWTVLGDSFTAGADSGTIQDGTYAGQKIVYPYLIGNRTGLNVVSFFAGGRTLAYPSVPGDFVNSITCPGQTYYYQNIPSDTDYITIYLGINDHHHLTGSGDGEDPTGFIDLGTIDDNTTATYYGAWNVVLGWLIANRPNAHIGIIVSNGITSTPTQESAHPTAEQSLWRKAQIDIAEKYGIPYIDLNGDARTRAMIRTSNPNIPSTIKQQMIENWAVDYPGGNYHPNNDAHEFESYIIEAFLRSI